ncbi:MAG: hypothetical protein IT384_03870 [Deltaproteobacteria bacterium]|nr:hypothetical protein [Deltaproteobacteria bacterium]
MDKLIDAAQEFLWRAWTTVGVRGTLAPIEDVVIDPEGLIACTGLAATDARLEAEAADWCARYFDFVSVTRLKNLANELPEEDRSRLYAFTASVNAVSSARWPGDGQPAKQLKLSGKSKLAPLSEGALAQLRYRAIFGTTARTEALLFLGRAQGWSSAGDVARATRHKKRIVAKALDELVVGGIVKTEARGNRKDFRLSEKKKLEAFAGPVASKEFQWVGWARVLSAYLRVKGKKPTVQRIELARAIAESGLDALPNPTIESIATAFDGAAGRQHAVKERR